ncbi:PH domain-containing protein [Clostridium sp. SYSU_GA19001]|uniref:PH domain-containing protein n=1 Tax=Clostridium caldaquaticum TaxID=2940653 RepID=UPI002076E1DC|nr:PH domain-containing protein [Clostridium caldaquaticum]MCM8710429.1 PH domain-containing protein [Clostridium caldaquaticum]
MVVYKPLKGIGVYYLLAMLIFYDILIILGVFFVNSYVISSLLKLLFVIFTVYQLYYILFYSSIKYILDDENVYISSFLRKIKISLKQIECYKINSGNINGVKLSGIITNSFAIGKSFIKKIGTTNIYVTSSKKILYLKSGDTNYALSPEDYFAFEEFLNNKGIRNLDWEYRMKEEVHLYKDKYFMIPFIIVSLIITTLTLNPFVLYLTRKLPDKMPLNFDSSFIPVDYGSGKQFAFNQMIYGVLNMAILFCMYYASHFYAKYDIKSAKKFIYISLVIALSFLLIQFRILYAFK